jgi:hypothetical protein
MTDLTVLIVTQTEEDCFLYESLLDVSEALKEKAKSYNNVKTTFYDKFQSGKKSATYDFVVAALLNENVTADDVEMQEDIFNYYATAPVFAWVHPSGDECEALKALFSKTHEKS